MRKYFVTLLFLLLVTACNTTPISTPQKPLIWVSIAPYQELIQRLAGPDIEVKTIVPQSLNPHSFEPTSKQVAQMHHKGVVWFQIGEPFEKKLLPLLQKSNPHLISYDLRKCVSLIEEKGLKCSHCSIDHQDRHIWMSPKDTKIQVAEVARVLQEIFPEKKEEIGSNLEVLIKNLTEVDDQIRHIFSSSPKQTFLVSHPAFGYFCRDYACRQLSIEYEGKEPGPKHIEEILRQASDAHIEIAIILPQYNNKGTEQLAEKLHIPTRMIDPYSSKYFETLLNLAHMINETKDLPQ